ncbi:MAG: hypothetical protein IPP19_09435 [Verrucomicrobia bacterium]|nr:hypothetical protein [Verrucomicrobiota bacterium]
MKPRSIALIENSLEVSSCRHPAEEIEPLPENEPRRLAAEIIGRVFRWVADGKTLDECGYKAIVALACIRPDLFDDISLAELGRRYGRRRQAVFTVKEKFHQETGFKPNR